MSLHGLYKHNNKRFDELYQEDLYEVVRTAPKFSFGNHDRYYKERYLERWNDPRLSLLKKEWFIGRRVLDIGCFEGNLTLQIALAFSPDIAIGIDIDYRAVRMAIKNMHKVVNEHTIRSEIVANMRPQDVLDEMETQQREASAEETKAEEEAKAREAKVGVIMQRI